MANAEHLQILRQGVEIWNDWREKNSEVLPDLEEAGLWKADLRRANLREADLWGADLQGADLGRANLREADLWGSDLEGANLEEADLREVNLEGANLMRADLRGANLWKTKLGEANLERVNLIRSDLRGANLWKADLGRAELWEANLGEANLEEANLWGADLGRADLKGANLSKANLAAATALSTNFTQAILTGACIQYWQTNSETNLENVTCDYIYLKHGQEKRRPASGNFKPGEFAKYVEKVLETVDLLFKDGIDWKAFLLSFQDLKVEYGEQNISIRAIERKSEGAFVIRLDVPPNADEAEVESRAKQSYETNLKILEAQYRAELRNTKNQYQDEIITLHKKHNADIFEMAKMMASRPITVEAKAVAESHSEKFTNDLRGANIANFANQVHDNARQVTSNISQNIAQNREEINKLVTYLREIAQELPEVQREEAMVHLDDLQEDITQPEKRKPQRIKTRIMALLAIAGTVASGVAMTTDFSNNVLDLADKLGVEIEFDLHNPTRGALDQ